MRSDYDVIVIGGGAAGLSGALTLARARRSVVVVDAGAPRNAAAHRVHGLLGLDGIAPAELLERGRNEVRAYGGEVVRGEVDAVTAAAGGFDVRLTDGRRAAARRVLVASGLVDELPEVAGVRERWGRDVIHCPYCHGWEISGMPVGVLATEAVSAVEEALLFRQWSDDIVLFTHTGPAPTAQDTERLNARGVRVQAGEVSALEVAGDQLAGVRMGDGTVVGRAVLVVSPRLVVAARFLRPLGLTPCEEEFGTGECFRVDATGQSAVAGVWMAGNVADTAAQVGTAAAAGATAAAHINTDLVEEDTARAVHAARRVHDKVS
ncbi:NAD(P)/FAD-dependent oxidoreductase [Actinoplanes subglobosus]|uniref:NAD(P)/FAD-dependent oxidoreductase n=1 Tax=Actinoplanes subglobosus TaxID=1547892 RepID=A0ABV8J1C9_9ACTN